MKIFIERPLVCIFFLLLSSSQPPTVSLTAKQKCKLKLCEYPLFDFGINSGNKIKIRRRKNITFYVHQINIPFIISEYMVATDKRHHTIIHTMSYLKSMKRLLEMILQAVWLGYTVSVSIAYQHKIITSVFTTASSIY